ncbi:DUF3883 domain-containing protein [Arthrobacter crusticola]|uniref:DUF3883 domain-containing protein n=1 Tax=Arthrobacter crusticola TaxID=2547960 RepID=A0A4R5TZI3_9MICC|nr:DUF3883 domain-containing protein [Arthrobacter crusticola]TDK26591.1 DUF3883 domain-containing protein [Arthrobacter crusticola]
MVFNTWWTSDPAQRFWMEITTRKDLGGDLMAPQAGGKNTTQWSYSLTALVQPGDVIFHYPTEGTDAGSVVGWSIVAGPAQTIPNVTWQARGTSGRRRNQPTTGPGWTVPLKDFTPLQPRLSKDTLQKALNELMELRGGLEAIHGKPVYFPWTRYRSAEMRAQQGYLAKFPAELVDFFDELRPVVRSAPDTDAAVDEPEDFRAPGRTAPVGRVTRAQDPILRAAIERRALDVAAGYYAGIGGTDLIELGKPYDIRVTVDGTDRHAEVKGSSMMIDTVELTFNEVHHAHGYGATDLIVVDSIEWARRPNGTVITRGGRMRVWSNWEPAAECLKARTFAYTLPPTYTP